MIATLIAALALQQTPAVEPTTEQRTADALEKAAAAAERLAAAAERLSPPPSPADVPVSTEAGAWDATIGANATWLSGNVNSVTFAGTASAIRKTKRTIFTARRFGGYGELYTAATDDAPASTEVLLFNAGGAASSTCGSATTSPSSRAPASTPTT